MDKLSKPEPVTTHEGLEFDRPIPTAVDPTKRRVARSGNITAILAKRALSKKRMQAMSEGFDNYAEIARELVAKHGKNVTVKHVRDLEKERDSRKPIDAEEVMTYVKKIKQIAEERKKAYTTQYKEGQVTVEERKKLVNELTKARGIVTGQEGTDEQIKKANEEVQKLTQQIDLLDAALQAVTFTTDDVAKKEIQTALQDAARQRQKLDIQQQNAKKEQDIIFWHFVVS